MSGLGLAGVLLLVWLLLWGSFSVANVVSGLLVAALVMSLLPRDRVELRLPTVRPIPALRFLLSVVREMVVANVVVAREVISRGAQIRTGVVEVPLPLCSEGLLTLVANVLALTPGTMPVEVERDPAKIYVHILHLRDVEQVRADVQKLAAQAVRAFGSAEAVAALEAGAGPDTYREAAR